jgi:predicted branched-subunit amino acid permease
MKTLFAVNFVVGLLFGFGFTLMPGTLVDFYGASLSDIGITVARLFGSCILSFSVLLWYARRSENQDFVVGVQRTMFTYWLLGTVFLVIAQLLGQMNTMGWVTIGLHVVFIAWYGYYIFKQIRIA